MELMPSSKNTRKIVVDSTGRITALLPENSSALPLRIGDRILVDRMDKSVNGRSAKKPLQQRMSGAKQSPLMKHAIETFGSEEAAEEWMSIECGALNNESPANFIHKTGNVAEVDRILGCIDYGMIA
jgi:hypothetical protein